MSTLTITPSESKTHTISILSSSAREAIVGYIEFKVALVSRNANSFGLHGHVLIPRTGAGFEVARSRGPQNDPQWNEGDIVRVPLIGGSDTRFLGWAHCSVEIPTNRGVPPQEYVDEIWGVPSGYEKTFNEQFNIGSTRYVVNYHNGFKKHKDGSPFFDIALFSNKRKKDAYVKGLRRKGYVECSGAKATQKKVG